MPIEIAPTVRRAVAIAALTLAGAPAAAQTLNDDVRCLMLGTAYANAAKDEGTRHVAALTASFYLGRLGDRMGDPAVVAAIRAQGKGIAAKDAQPIMQACAARAAAAQAKMAAALRAAQPR